MAEPVPLASFSELFGLAPEVVASAPGRVNLIGEHTDYNEGYVLPVAIPQRTRIELAPRRDGVARVWSANVKNGEGIERFTIGAEEPRRGWVDYVQGITWVLRDEGLAVPGFDARITSEVPVGSGLSSSAALEVALLRALREAFALPIDDVRLARLGQRAENDFVGAPVGIMDPMAASLVDTESALFLDTRALTYELIPMPAAIEVIVIDSGVPHAHAAEECRARRAECHRACELLGVPALRDVAIADLDRVDTLPEPLARRARHVVTENARVLMAVGALRAGDLEALGQLFDASHASMRDDYEVSVPSVDLLVEIARAEPEVSGARLTGCGFGGSVVVLARRGAAGKAAARIARAYTARSGLTPAVLVPQDPCDAAAAA